MNCKKIITLISISATALTFASVCRAVDEKSLPETMPPVHDEQPHTQKSHDENPYNKEGKHMLKEETKAEIKEFHAKKKQLWENLSPEAKQAISKSRYHHRKNMKGDHKKMPESK